MRSVDPEKSDGSRALETRDLRTHYRAFLQDSRILLTGHSHQAWPDVAREAMLEAFDDAARHVDDKWQAAFNRADQVRAAVAKRIACEAAEVALAPNTHELVVRWLSALDWSSKKRLVATTGEFHTIRRQLARLAEFGMAIELVETTPVRTLAERLADAITSETAGELVSNVLYETSEVVPNLGALATLPAEHDAELLIDAYHAFNVVPFSVSDIGARAWVVSGGYKYAQWGEGACFLRVPTHRELRPVYTGWFSDFAGLAASSRLSRVGYGSRPADCFAGSTYDPVSHYRAARVAAFFDEHGLDVHTLRAISFRQTQRVIDALGACTIVSPRDESRGGFVSVRSMHAEAVVRELRAKNVFVDSRSHLVRIGPAPYLTDAELDAGVRHVRDAIAKHAK